VTTLALKLALTPLLIVGASLAGRRWGSAVSGSLVGLPLTSGPIAAFLAVEHGPRFAARSSVGALSGAGAECAFCLGYAWCVRRGPVLALALATIGFAALAAVAEALPLRADLPSPLLPLAGAVVAVLAAATLLLPRVERVPPSAEPPARWDLPVRAIVATALVLLFTGVATALGARLTGLLAVFPVYVAVLTVFAHGSGGADAALAVLHGVTLGLFSFAAFSLTLAALLGRIDTAAAFACAVAAALVVQALALARLRERRSPLLPASRS
jgi:uncharacterized membrane protein (GlpM family)